MTGGTFGIGAVGDHAFAEREAVRLVIILGEFGHFRRRWRNAIAEATPGARDVLAREKVTCYIGFDPTAVSLHVGNLVPIMGLVRMR